MKKHIILFIAIFFASVLHAQTINIRGDGSHVRIEKGVS